MIRFSGAFVVCESAGAARFGRARECISTFLSFVPMVARAAGDCGGARAVRILGASTGTTIEIFARGERARECTVTCLTCVLIFALAALVCGGAR